MIGLRPIVSLRMGIHRLDRKVLNPLTENTSPESRSGIPNDVAYDISTGRDIDIPMNSVATAVRTNIVDTSLQYRRGSRDAGVRSSSFFFFFLVIIVLCLLCPTLLLRFRQTITELACPARGLDAFTFALFLVASVDVVVVAADFAVAVVAAVAAAVDGDDRRRLW
mmetsp:Transcript_8075/g.18044  ORF Transcript_8075/g.18044 Transcript_8075/m.18044 type:complete len:166 (-) Transcript_8075:619-1116(-)